MAIAPSSSSGLLLSLKAQRRSIVLPMSAFAREASLPEFLGEQALCQCCFYEMKVISRTPCPTQ
jgi:hypothetical protein